MEIITLKPHNYQWKTTFLEEKKLIHNAIKKYIHTIHHVGSTAIPDLLSKPIIDIAVESEVFPPSQLIIDHLSAIGYQYKGNGGITDRIWFTKGQPRKFNLHFCPIHSEIVERQILFRDTLIENAQFRRAYEEIKLKNYKSRDIDSAEYAFSKSGFINQVLTLK